MKTGLFVVLLLLACDGGANHVPGGVGEAGDGGGAGHRQPGGGGAGGALSSCSGAATMDCINGCITGHVLSSRVCQGGAWTCPSGTVPSRSCAGTADCPFDMGGPCSDGTSGISYSPQCSNGTWICPPGTHRIGGDGSAGGGGTSSGAGGAGGRGDAGGGPALGGTSGGAGGAAGRLGSAGANGAGGRGGRGAAGAGGPGGAGGAGRLYGLTPGSYCFDVLSVESVVDGCGEGASPLVGQRLPLDYEDPSQGRVSLGTKGFFGSGLVSLNKAVLTRSGLDMRGAMPACAWHEDVATSFELTADNRFTAAVTETRSMFAAACAPLPASDPCTTTFSMTLQIHVPGLPPDVLTGVCP